MIGNVSLYSMRGSLSTGEYPLLDGTETPVQTFQNIGYQAGLQTEIRLPTFSGYDTVNVAKIDDRYYWITAFYERTNANGQIFYTLDYMGPTSWIKRGQSMTAYLDRSPVYLCDYLADSWTKGRTDIYNGQDIGTELSDYQGNPMYWVQITGVDTDGDYRRYGCFVRINMTGTFSEPIIDYSVRAPNGYYPSLKQIINNVADFTPFTAESIKDISISRRTPYVHITKTIEEMTTIRTEVIGLSATDYINPSANGSGSYLTYDIDTIINTNNSRYLIPEQIIEITLNDQMRMSGSFIVKDWNKNTVASFPVSEGNELYVQTYTDYSGIYTVISNDRRLISIPEGKIPYAGSGWDTYRAYDMVADRQQMLNSITYADRERQTELIGGTAESLISGALTGALAGGPVGAGLGVVTGGVSAIGNIASSSIKRDLELSKARDDLALKEMRAKNSIGTGYNVSYGLIYLTLTASDGNLVIGPELPLEDSSALLSAYTDRVGYPCEGLQTLNATNGYYQGYLPADVGSGVYFNELNRTFRQGFKFVTP